MQEKPIGVFDSGMGGITILSKIMEYLPNEDYIYFGDSLHNPYGEKSEKEIMDYAILASRFLIDKGCKAIVVACNTASSVAIDRLRKIFPHTLFIATIPALKVAMDEDRKQNVLVMATKATLASKKFQDLYQSYQEEHDHIYLLNCSNLANLIEEEVQTAVDQKLKHLLLYYQTKNIDVVVLGCTHYPLIKKNIQTLLQTARLIDGSDGIRRQLKGQLVEHDLLNTQTRKGRLTIYNSLGNQNVQKTWKILYAYQEQENKRK